MKKTHKILSILALPLLIAGCKDKVSELYVSNAYDTGSFARNYYTSWNNVDNIEITNTTTRSVANIYSEDPKVIYDNNTIRSESFSHLPLEYQKLGDKTLDWCYDKPVEDYGVGFGPTKNLSTIDESFKYGYLSKLYDGRVRCDNLQAKSRVQIDKTGYATFFPKELKSYSYFGMAVRGGTTCARPFSSSEYPTVDFKLCLYKPNEESGYQKYEILLNDVEVKTNAGGFTSYIYFNLSSVFENEELVGSTAMSLTFNLKSVKYDDLVDDMNAEGKEHFAIMLYEVMFLHSTWF